EILHQRMWETNSYKTHEDHMMLYEALKKSMNRDHSEELLKDLAKARKKKRRDSPKTPPGSPPHQPPPPPPLAGPSGASGSPGASGSSQVSPPPPPPPSTNQEARVDYPDVGLKKMVPDQMWIEEECKHTSEGEHRAVRTHMWILSVVRIKVFSMYGYDYMKKIVLRRADLNEHIIAERDF
nr:hypothetical protein [Tanacetum cinerariifolium]